jgi:hypothetical protein
MKTKNKVYKKFIHIFLAAAIIASSLGFVGIARKTLADNPENCYLSNSSGYCNPTVSIDVGGTLYFNGYQLPSAVSPGSQIGVDGYISGATVLSACSQSSGGTYTYVSEFDDIPQPATADVSGPNGTQSLPVQTYDGYGTPYLGHCDPDGSGGAEGDLGGGGDFGGYQYGIDTTGFPDGYYTSDIYLPTGQSEALIFIIAGGNNNNNGGNGGSSINVSVVNAPNNETATWYIQTPQSVPPISDSGSSVSYPDSAFPTSLDSGAYNIQRDANDYNDLPYGFNMFSYSDTALRNPPTFLARIIKTVEAQSYTCSPSQNCMLASGGNITWQLTPTWCVLNVIVEINGVSTQMSGLSYSISGGIDGSSPVYTGAPQSNIIMDADNSGTQFTLNGFPPTISYSNGTADLSSITPANPYSCSGGSGMTFFVNYTTRAALNVQ